MTKLNALERLLAQQKALVEKIASTKKAIAEAEAEAKAKAKAEKEFAQYVLKEVHARVERLQGLNESPIILENKASKKTAFGKLKIEVLGCELVQGIERFIIRRYSKSGEFRGYGSLYADDFSVKDGVLYIEDIYTDEEAPAHEFVKFEDYKPCEYINDSLWEAEAKAEAERREKQQKLYAERQKAKAEAEANK